LFAKVHQKLKPERMNVKEEAGTTHGFTEGRKRLVKSTNRMREPKKSDFAVFCTKKGGGCEVGT